jgi:hypothetical protein
MDRINRMDRIKTGWTGLEQDGLGWAGLEQDG